MKHSNPYYNTASINDPELFFNRLTNIETLLNSVFSDTPQCCSIIGQRKIGKTSLVQHLFRPTTIQGFEYNNMASNCLFVYFDCQMHSNVLESREEFYRALLSHLHFNIPDQFKDILLSLSLESNDDYVEQKWERILKGVAKKDIRIIVIFDEFEKAIIREALIKEGLFGSLRGYAQHNPNFAWITCTNRPLHDLFKEVFDEYGISKIQRRSESDFYNIAIPHVVGLFEKVDTFELITSPAKSRGVEFSSEDVETILKFGGNFPYFVQRACYYLFNAHLKGTVQRESILQQNVREAKQLWEGYWEKLNTEQQTILAAIARGQFTGTSVYELWNLKEESLVYEDGRDIKPFSEEFGYFILSLSGERKIVVTLQQVGQPLNNRYEVRELVGETDHSRVVKAWDVILERIVAIKFLYIDHKTDSQVAQQFQRKLLREARILANLRHTHIGQVYDIVLEPLGVVMEWVEGTSLQEIINDADEQLPVTDVINVGIEMADVLCYAHKRLIIHRDIKPSNIILTDDEERKPVLIDFDIAHAGGHETISLLEDGSRGYVGTRVYSAPEQLRKEAVEPPTDLFALGVVLYEMLTHQRPYKWGNDPSLYEGGHFPKPEQFDIPEPLYQILCKLLSEKPAERLNAATLKEELQNCLNLLKQIAV